jgi:shikimate kinase
MMTDSSRITLRPDTVALSESIKSAIRHHASVDNLVKRAGFDQALLRTIDEGAIEPEALAAVLDPSTAPNSQLCSRVLGLAWIDQRHRSTFLLPWIRHPRTAVLGSMFALDVVAMASHAQRIPASIAGDAAVAFVRAWTGPLSTTSAQVAPDLLGAVSSAATLIVGSSGTGKSAATSNSRVSRCSFIDLDDYVAGRAGRDMARLFDEWGAHRVREFYARLLVELLAGAGAGEVLVLGSSALMSPMARQAVGCCKRTIWVDASGDAISRRLTLTPKHAASLLASAPPLAFDAIRRARNATFYTATHYIDSSNLSLIEVRNSLLKAVTDD